MLVLADLTHSVHWGIKPPLKPPPPLCCQAPQPSSVNPQIKIFHP